MISCVSDGEGVPPGYDEGKQGSHREHREFSRSRRDSKTSRLLRFKIRRCWLRRSSTYGARGTKSKIFYKTNKKEEKYLNCEIER